MGLKGVFGSCPPIHFQVIGAARPTNRQPRHWARVRSCRSITLCPLSGLQGGGSCHCRGAEDSVRRALPPGTSRPSVLVAIRATRAGREDVGRIITGRESLVSCLSRSRFGTGRRERVAGTLYSQLTLRAAVTATAHTTLGVAPVKVKSDIYPGRIALRRMIGGPVPLEGLGALASWRVAPLALLQEPNQITQLEKEKTR